MSWKLLKSDRIIKLTELSDYINTEMQIPDEFSNFFGKEGERLALLYNGREYPAYIESEGGNTKLKWSKVLVGKLREAFPQYESWFQDTKDEDKTPRLEITKTNDCYSIRLLTEGEERDTDESETYMEKVDIHPQQKSGLKELFKKWIISYPNYYPRDFRFSFKDVINEEIPKALAGLENIRDGNYKVQGFAGDNQWAEIPWVTVMDKRIRNSMEDGLYLTYLLAMDSKKLYLAIVYGESGISPGSLSEKVRALRKTIHTGDYETNHQKVMLEDAVLVSGILCYREYTEDMPEDNVLEAEFEDFRKMYDSLISEEVDKNNNNEFLKESAENHKGIIDENRTELLLEMPIDQENEISQKMEEIEIDQIKVSDQETVDPVFPSYGTGYRSDLIDSVDESEEDNTEAVQEDFSEDIIANESITEVGSIQASEDGPSEDMKNVPYPIKDTPEIAQSQNEYKNEKINVKETSNFTQRLKRYPAKNEGLTSYLQLVLAKMGNKGFYYPPELVKSYYLSLKSKPFVILKGSIGSGKTSFPRLFAEAIGANTENGRYLRVLVGKNWNNEKSIFGSIDTRGHFIPGSFMILLKAAKEYPEKPYFFLLDEMDQSPIENYLRLLLEGINGSEEPFLSREDFGADVAAFREYGGLGFPDNLYIIGTINEGPGSFPIEPKVIDSGNTIEMPVVEIGAFPNFGSPIGDSNWENNQFKIQNKSQGLPEIIEKLMRLLNDLQSILVKFDQPMGYRGKNEILTYGINSGVEDLFMEEEVIDLAILQKILPVLSCYPNKNEKLYKELACFCADDHLKESLLNETTLAKFCAHLEKLLSVEAIPCPRSGQYILKRLKKW